MGTIHEEFFRTPAPCEVAGIFRIDEEKEQTSHLTNAVLHCYMLISAGLIHTSPPYPVLDDRDVVLQWFKK